LAASLTTQSGLHLAGTRQIASLTSPEISALDKSSALVILPLAAVEQHGPHLPCSTDTVIADELVSRAIAATPASVEVWTLPSVPYGKSNEHRDFPGTATLSAETLTATCREIGRSVAEWGFRKLALVNSHGGQIHLLEVAARDIREETGLQVFPLYPYRAALPDGLLTGRHEARFGIHGGELETSLMLAIDAASVRLDRLEAGGKAVQTLYAPGGRLSLEGEFPTAWLTRDLSANGVIGDPREATREKGERALTHLAEALASVFAEICSFEFDHAI
jgi:creatinine amidohydrolase